MYNYNPFTGKHKQVCKNILKMNKTTFSKVSALGFFDIDAELSLSFIRLLSDYIIVLIQFAFI